MRPDSHVCSITNYAEKMVHDLFDGSQGFAIDGGIKDSTHIRRLATELNSPMPALVSVLLNSTTEMWK